MLGQVILGKYKVTRFLDEGGMSKVFLARQADLDRDAVVKVLKDHLKGQAKAVEHFRREIHITARFHHPHAVACYDWSTRPPHGPVLVMEYLRGVDLNGLLAREGRFTPERTGRLLVQLCDVLQAAHEAGIVHRDLKPGNLMVLHPGTPQETVKLMDFGLAKMSTMLYISPEELIDFSLPAASGTPEYISPEMVRGNELDARADLYSVGVILFELLAGRRPFTHASVSALMLAHADEPAPTFADVGITDVPPALEAVVRSCLAKYPEERPATAWELAQAFEKALGRRLVGVRAPAAGAARPGGSGASGSSPPGRATLADPALTVTPPPPERNSIRHTVEASMPEVMAMIKLKGFIGDLGGEVVESVPGLIRVRLPEPKVKRRSGLLRLIASATGSGVRALPAPEATDLELYMERRDPAQPSRLTISLVLRPEGGMGTPDWRERCNRIGRDLQAYLMGR